MNPHLIMPLSVLSPVITGASIFSILQNPIKDKNDDYFVVVTDEVSNDVIKRVSTSRRKTGALVRPSTCLSCKVPRRVVSSQISGWRLSRCLSN